jgi:tetratricopeptide (TPR) repeat protein
LRSLKKALMISREIADHRGEGRTLNNLGQIYTDQGEKEWAEQYYKQALSIRQEAKDFNGESTTLRNLGLIYADLGRKDDALR